MDKVFKSFLNSIIVDSKGEPEDKKTIDILAKTEIKGTWLNLGAGEGRYCKRLLSKANKVIAADYNPEKLKILSRKISKANKTKLKIEVFDMTGKFPFEDSYFDGIFCTGTLHTFSEKNLIKIFREIKRVLKPEGKLIFDFATEVKRIQKDGKFYKYGNETFYSSDEAKKLLDNLLSGYTIKKYVNSSVNPFEFDNGEVSYTFSCNFFLIEADKTKTSHPKHF